MSETDRRPEEIPPAQPGEDSPSAEPSAPAGPALPPEEEAHDGKPQEAPAVPPPPAEETSTPAATPPATPAPEERPPVAPAVGGEPPPPPDEAPAASVGFETEEGRRSVPSPAPPPGGPVTPSGSGSPSPGRSASSRVPWVPILLGVALIVALAALAVKAWFPSGDSVGIVLGNTLGKIQDHENGSMRVRILIEGDKPGKPVAAITPAAGTDPARGTPAAADAFPRAPGAVLPPPPPPSDWSAMLKDYQEQVLRDNGIDPTRVKQDDVRAANAYLAKVEVDNALKAEQKARKKAVADSSRLRNKLEEAIATKTKVDADLAASTGQVNDLTTKLAASDDAKVKAEVAVAKAQKQIDALKASAVTAKAKADLATELKRLNNELKAAGDAKAAAESSSSALQQELQKAKAKAAATEKEAADLKTKVDVLQKFIDDSAKATAAAAAATKKP